MSNPYYKSRALYQLAEFYDEKSDKLLNESFILAKTIPELTLKFQVLEKIFSIVHYKESNQKSFIKEILTELFLSYENINEQYDRVIASIRLSFYESGEFRKKYLANAIETLIQMDEDDDKIKLIIKLKPLITIYDDLHVKLNSIIESLKNKTSHYFVNSYYGRILFNEKLNVDIPNLNLNINENTNFSNYTELQALFLLFAQLNDTKLLMNKTESIDQLWINLFKNTNNQSDIEEILNISLHNEIILPPQVAIIIDELIQQGKENIISILFPYIIKPSNEVLPIVHRWFTNYDQSRIKQLAAILLAEAKHIFEPVIDTIIDLMKSDNDQMRYRAQRIFQHPERSPNEPKHLPRVRSYIASFLYDLLWDDPLVFRNLILFINDHIWNLIMRALESSTDPSYVEELLYSVMFLTQHDQITRENWIEFARILSITDTSQFKEKIFFVRTEVERIQFIIDNICTLTDINDETYIEILESKLINQTTVTVEHLPQMSYNEIKSIGSCNLYVSYDLNQITLNMLNNISINIILMENLIKWLIKKMTSFKYKDDTIFSIVLCSFLLSLISACVQKEDYLYRKITNSASFNKIQMIKLLEKMLHYHPYFSARGSAFILLAAIDHCDHKVIINTMNALLDENVVKEYFVIGFPLIHLSPNELVDDLLESLQSESAIKTYEILNIFTDFTLNEKIDTKGKSKIINYLAREIIQLKSKKPINYYYTDVKIPFTTILENELYKAWIKIQGLSGKTQHSIKMDE
ncbi:unnamed protein product [Rotaria sordida]|uniref:Uncharacterized protein n=1 Tax=Rotaria sordida TaxID=392033 RepID=A0A818WMF4_9BILA|nr:unnamed protein product [Rotaria sordida]